MAVTPQNDCGHSTFWGRAGLISHDDESIRLMREGRLLARTSWETRSSKSASPSGRHCGWVFMASERSARSRQDMLAFINANPQDDTLRYANVSMRICSRWTISSSRRSPCCTTRRTRTDRW